MPVPGFRSKSALYDILLIAGLPMPGEWRCPQLGRGYKLKHPKGDGDDEGTIRNTGLAPTTGTIESHLDTDEEERKWYELLKKVFRLDRPKDRNAVSIDHPQFKESGIRSICISSYEDPIAIGGEPRVVRLHWRNATLPTGKSTTKKPGSAPPTTNSAIQRKTAFDTDTPAQQATAAGGR